jgi:hypothetical protein
MGGALGVAENASVAGGVSETVAVPTPARPQPPRPERSAAVAEEHAERSPELPRQADALTAALTDESPKAPALGLGGTLVMAPAASAAEAAKPPPAESVARPAEAAASKPSSEVRKATPMVHGSSAVAPSSSKTGWFGLLVAGLVAALISYGLFSYLKGAVRVEKSDTPALTPPER